MRVLVTGASGTLAPLAIRALWERHEVVLLSRRPPVWSKNSYGFALYNVESITKVGQAQHSSLPNHGAPPSHASRDPWHPRFLMRSGSGALPNPYHWVRSSV
jgi:nucleoside-diphosphate-sugar epimerase